MKPFTEFRKSLSAISQILLVCLLVLLLVVFVVVMISENPRWIFDLLGLSRAGGPETVAGNSKYEVLKFIGISMGGVLIALQALIANKRANAMEQTAKAQADASQAQADAAKAQAGATEEQAKANWHTEQGQRQERLKNAIEHLGHESSASVRLGGAYELFHLAQDTKELRQTVLDILCAHIRRATDESDYRKTYKSKPSEEVQSLLTLLFVQDHEVFRGLRINLQGTWLNGANLRGARLEKAILSEACLRGVELADANLKEADMTKAHLQEADMTKARMQRACLRRARMQGACLNEARLNGAKLYGVEMQGVKLIAAQMQGALLLHAEMQGADLYGARLQLAVLTDVKLQAARLVGAQLQAATLDGVYLGGVTFGGSSSPEVRIRDRIGMQGSLVGAIFQGGLTERDVTSILEIVSDEEPSVLRARLESHVDAPVSHELPEGSEATTEPYTKEEAEQWIAEYEKAMSDVQREIADAHSELVDARY